MQKTKKQKYEQQIRKSLRTILNLQPQLVQFLKNLPLKKDSLLNRSYPPIHALRLLRIFTLMEINFVVSTFLDIVEKTKVLRAQNLKVGIIGGGVMGKLILNTLLIFTKQGLKTDNIMVSTRQPQHLQFYTENFGIKTFFDNQKIAKQCDLIFVATPSTLDNWIVVDLKKHIESRISTNSPFETNRTSYASTISVQHSQAISKISPIVQSQSTKNKISQTQNLALSLGKTSKKIINPTKQEPLNLSPFVYVMTSDITEQKAKKIFSFPMMVPWVRATDISMILEKIKVYLSEKQVGQLLPEQNSEKIIKALQAFMTQEINQSPNKKQATLGQNSFSQPSRIDSFIIVLTSCCKKLENHWRLNVAFLKQKSEFQAIQINKLYNQVLQSQGSYEQTYLTKAKKWRMAYNNFIG